MKEPVINITKDILRLVAELDEFKGEWKALGSTTIIFSQRRET